MGKIIITADIHCGVPGKLKDCIWAMETINNYALENNIEDVLVLGDLFHDRISLGIDVINAVFDQLKIMKNSGIKWMAFSGNHDLFYKNRWDCNSIHSFKDILDLEEGLGVRIIKNQRFYILPFIYQELTYMKVLQEIDKRASKDDILLTHIGVCGAVMNECFLLKNWSVVKFDDTKFDRIFSGHYHCYQTVGKLTYPGSPISFRFDEGVVDHGFVVFDTDTRTHEFILISDAAKGGNYIAPDYLTIIDKDLKNRINMVKGNNIKIMLSKEMNPSQINKIKNTLHKLGAISVTTSLITKQIQEPTLVYKEKNFGSPKQLFTEFVNAENPKLDKELLHKLHDSISQEAEERALIEISSDAEIADQ